MIKKQITILFAVLTLSLNAQTTADFENFSLMAETALFGDDNNGGFSSGNIFLHNDYNATYNSWSGFAISNVTDTTTPGFNNQFGNITGAGVNNSPTFATSFVFGASHIKLENDAAGAAVEGVYITNGTYAYLSMLEGDSFAKKFGGVTGDDPDYFLLTIKKYLNGVLSTDSVNFYMADFRFEDNSMDYIVNEWTYVDLTSLGEVDSLVFTMSSTDIGIYGMNTPAFFCIDELTTSDGLIELSDLENFNVGSESFLNGSDGSGGFSDSNVFFPNNYNEAYMSWTGWAISNVTDNTTQGFANQYSAIAGGGSEGSANYAVSFVFPESYIGLENEAAEKIVSGLYITNSTWAYYSMLEGDGFAKQFGGVTGNDPDYFVLTIKKYLNGVLSTDSVDFYLADYRFDDNDLDYIVDDWTFVDLTSLGKVDSLVFSLNSTDVGSYGMNTPAYFCIDSKTQNVISSESTPVVRNDLKVFPNPTGHLINVMNLELGANCSIYNMQGSLLLSQNANFGQTQIDVSGFPAGTYLLRVQEKGVVRSQLFVKK